MSKVDLEIIRGLSQAAGDLYDGALDAEGKPFEIGLKREELPITDRSGIDGAKIKFVGNKLCIYYESEITLKEVYKNGANAFQSNIDEMIQNIANFLKKNYRVVEKKSVALTPDDEESTINITYVSRNRVLCSAYRHYNIGGLSDVLAATNKDQKKVELSKNYQKFLDQGGFEGKRPKNDTRPKNA